MRVHLHAWIDPPRLGELPEAVELVEDPRAARLFDQRALRRWEDRFSLPDLEGRTALLLGAGSIGEAVAARLEPFGVELIRVGASSASSCGGWPGARP